MHSSIRMHTNIRTLTSINYNEHIDEFMFPFTVSRHLQKDIRMKPTDIVSTFEQFKLTWQRIKTKTYCKYYGPN